LEREVVYLWAEGQDGWYPIRGTDPRVLSNTRAHLPGELQEGMRRVSEVRSQECRFEEMGVLNLDRDDRQFSLAHLWLYPCV
jgi:hypothetical protein